MILRVSSVMIPRVPSEPTIRLIMLYPVEVLLTCAPKSTTSPVGRTTFMART